MGHPSHKFIGLAGNIGAGKSTLTHMLASHFGWKPFYEANAENPYLADFYTDMQRWSFHSQVFFLGKRLEHHRQLLDHPGEVIQDRTVYEDAEIFARNLHRQGYMNDRDYDAYRRLYQAVAAFVPAPDLLIYLEADVDTLLKHVRKRGRAYERSISPDYLHQLNELYDAWISAWSASPILKINMQNRDFQHNERDFAEITTHIRDTLFSTT